ncbi:YjbH domain-containing protein [Psychrobium sp. 1_MG-2023]|uniref:YjbH domain-containing protein n=1 Tax=Psychrobium sp. 1_MG-2023 TaxID=3062624 RepID=UPI000C32418B|nr:YjbH domain-containing protein [Psychrobium sp. 1_MG-2023]MDP2561107.1 YjbH domain-containing protein [Psychrobium sp. 1_MG-2023]PKF55084.1 hypothetical protein CW748_14050 [Alteromonadales bacterium alter-6D02]
MKKPALKALALCSLSIACTSAMAQKNITTSYQGFSGLINTPTADIFETGIFHFQQSNQTEARGQYRDGNNLHFGLGLWEHVEVSGRLADYKDQNGKALITDLSANVKFTIPYIPKDWFTLAIGVQDAGGAANNFGAKYAVASKTLFEDIQVSLGASSSDSKVGRMDGFFGSVAWQATDWAKLSVEHDSSDTNVGLHLSSPKEWLNNQLQVKANLLAYSSNDQLSDNIYYGIEINVPMHTKTSFKQKTSKQAYRYIAQDVVDNTGTLEKVKNKLTEEGFESIRVGEINSSTAYIELENHIYNRNQIDGLGVALAIINTNLSKQYTQFKLVTKEQEVSLLAITGNTADYLAFLNEEKPLAVGITTDVYNTNETVTFVNKHNSNKTWFKPRLTLWPSIISTVGTEFGMFDASLGLASHLEVPLWSGAALTAQHITHISETEDFKDGRYFENSRHQTGMQGYSLNQTFTLPYNLKNMTTVGRDRYDHDFVSNEIRWQSSNGAHRANVITSKYENQVVPPREHYQGCNILFAACWKPAEDPNRTVIVGEYRYYASKLNTSFEVQAGQFWQQDKGYILSLKRMFGDVIINMSYRDTKKDDIERNQFVGIGFSIPFTPRKDFNSKYFQVRGLPNWNYGISTLVGKSHNRLTPGSGDTGARFYNLDNAYFNYDRLNAAYIKNNAYRLQEAAKFIK